MLPTYEQMKKVLADKEIRDAEEKKTERERLNQQIEDQRKQLHDLNMREASLKDQVQPGQRAPNKADRCCCSNADYEGAAGGEAAR